MFQLIFSSHVSLRQRGIRAATADVLCTAVKLTNDKDRPLPPSPGRGLRGQSRHGLGQAAGLKYGLGGRAAESGSGGAIQSINIDHPFRKKKKPGSRLERFGAEVYWLILGLRPSAPPPPPGPDRSCSPFWRERRAWGRGHRGPPGGHVRYPTGNAVRHRPPLWPPTNRQPRATTAPVVGSGRSSAAAGGTPYGHVPPTRTWRGTRGVPHSVAQGRGRPWQRDTEVPGAQIYAPPPQTRR